MTRLTSDRYFLLTYFFWMFAGCLPLIPIIFLGIATSQIIWGSPDARDVYYFFVWLGWLVGTSAVAYALFRLGLRNREVVLDGRTLLVQWGRRMPITVRRVDVASLANFEVTREKRFAMNARSSGHYGMPRMPDRWRLKATAGRKTVDLGSYATEAEASGVVSIMQSNAM